MGDFSNCPADRAQSAIVEKVSIDEDMRIFHIVISELYQIIQHFTGIGCNVPQNNKTQIKYCAKKNLIVTDIDT